MPNLPRCILFMIVVRTRDPRRHTATIVYSVGSVGMTLPPAPTGLIMNARMVVTMIESLANEQMMNRRIHTTPMMSNMMSKQ
jgi:hypothetical protein